MLQPRSEYGGPYDGKGKSKGTGKGKCQFSRSCGQLGAAEPFLGAPYCDAMPAFTRTENDELEFIRYALDSLPTARILDVFAHVMGKGISKGIGMVLDEMERKSIIKGIIIKDISKGKSKGIDESKGVGQEAERGRNEEEEELTVKEEEFEVTQRSGPAAASAGAV